VLCCTAVEEVETNPDLMQVPVLKSLLFETFRYKANPKTPFLFTPLNTKRRKGTTRSSFGRQHASQWCRCVVC
jgi:hypothetical protein